MVQTIIEVFKNAVRLDDKFIISKGSIKTHFASEIDEIREKYSKMTEGEKKSFKSTLSKVDSDTFSFIEDFFGIDRDNY